jgi:hypothetical protein
MGIVISLILIAFGAILTWAVYRPARRRSAIYVEEDEPPPPPPPAP